MSLTIFGVVQLHYAQVKNSDLVVPSHMTNQSVLYQHIGIALNFDYEIGSGINGLVIYRKI